MGPAPQLAGTLGVVAPLGAAGGGMLLLYAIQSWVAWRKQAHAEESAKASTGLEIKKHRDGLTIQMLEMARAEVAAARAEVRDLRAELEARDDELTRLRRIEWRLSAHEEAIRHIEALLLAEVSGGREAAEHAARLFLARMEAMKLAAGEEAQAEQRERAAQAQIERKDGE